LKLKKSKPKLAALQAQARKRKNKRYLLPFGLAPSLKVPGSRDKIPKSGLSPLSSLFSFGHGDGIFSAIIPNMPRKTVPLSVDFPYHVTARCINREWFRIPMPEVWRLMEDYLFFITQAYGVEVLSFVLMTNHFHLLVRAPQGNLSEAMNYFMRETSRRIGEMAGRINQTYGSRFHRTLVSDPYYYQSVYKYVYRNPVEAGLCWRAEDYPYSTLHGLIGRTKLNFDIAYDSTLFFSYEETLRWVNEAQKPDELIAIKSGLSKAIFELAAQRSGRPEVSSVQRKEPGTF
jgi:REP element-mobilizing transposase RayT